MQATDLGLARAFAGLPDPPIDRTKKHLLGDILAITLCAVICGADSWEEVEAFGEAKHDWLRQLLALPHGIPSYDTFNRVFARLDPVAFGQCVAGWVGAVCERPERPDVALLLQPVDHGHRVGRLLPFRGRHRACALRWPNY